MTGDPEFDLHGYSCDTALDLAVLRTREAWEHGCATVKFIHGSAGVAARPRELDLKFGRPPAGAVKWTLRDALRTGRFRPYAARAGHRLAPDALTLALNPCPDPDALMPWASTPPREF